jgi:cell division protein FtsZ
MTINFTAPPQDNQLKPRITVIGVGGAGGNAVNNMISKKLEGVEFVVANTDAQSLAQSIAERRIQLGTAITHGLGAGSRPDMGRAAAEEAIDDIHQHLQGSHMVFIAAGMGGGTGTGAAPVIARLAREQGILTVGVVTKPFQFEGSHRSRIAEAGIEEMQQFVDTLIVIPNQNLFRIANEKTTFADAFAMADDVLHSGVRGVTDLMVVPGLINLDFADIRTVMSEMGKAMMGTGEAEGDDRAKRAAEAAISNPLLDDVSMKGARGVLINITGGPDMTLFEVDEAANRIGEEVDPEANIIFGSALDPSLQGVIRVSVVATGIDLEAGTQPRPVLKVYTEAVARPAPRPAATRPQPVETLRPVPARAQATDAPAGTESGQPAKADAGGDARAAAEIAAATPARPAAPVTERPFMPPPAADPRNPEPARQPDPFKAADLLNPAPAIEKKRASSLFRRITGTGQPRNEPERTAKREPPVLATSNERAAPPPPRPEPAPARTEAAAPVQRRLDGVDPQDRGPAQSQGEDDLLDIPAFLRRQAN